MRGKIVELCRTSHDKKHDDLIRCAKIPRYSNMFLDDQHHPLMENDNVYYINVKPLVILCHIRIAEDITIYCN